jgi:hypothetical protein
LRFERDNVLERDPVYQGESLATISTETTADLCRSALDACLIVNQSIARRFGTLKSEKPLQQREETEWLKDGLGTWFCKKWNDKRRMDEAKKAQPKKSKPQVCDTCNGQLTCACCQANGQTVFTLFMRSSDLDRTARTAPPRPTLPPDIRKREFKLMTPALLPSPSVLSSRHLRPAIRPSPAGRKRIHGQSRMI